MHCIDMNSFEDFFLSPKAKQLLPDQSLLPIQPLLTHTPKIGIYNPATLQSTPDINMTQENFINSIQYIQPLNNISMDKENVHQIIKNQRNCTKWTLLEDKALIHIVKTTQIPSWDLIQAQLAIVCPRDVPRTREQCYQRWHRVINPYIKKGKWTKQEDILLLKAICKHKDCSSKKWAEIAQDIPSRTDIQVRYRAIKIKAWLIENGVDEQYIK